MLEELLAHAGIWGLLGGLLLLSAGFSASETALFSLTPADLARFRAGGGAIDRAVLALHGDLRRVLLTVLFGNMAVNVLFFAVSTLQASGGGDGTGGVWREILAGVASLAAVLLMGEVLPKNAAIAAAPSLARLTAVPLLAVHRALTAPLAIFDRFARFVARAGGLAARESANARLAAEELRLLIDVSRADGVLDDAESDWLDRVVTLPDIQLRDVMTHRVDAIAVDADDSVARAVATARAAGRARLPVRDPERDEWIGWLDARELGLPGARADTDADDTVRAHLHPPLWLSEFDRADQALARLFPSEGPLGFVVDEHGVVSGLVTQSDLLSELFGDWDDEPRDAAVREVEGGWVLPGATSVRAWRRWLGNREDLPDCSTVGGLVTVILGRPARRGDVVRWRNVRLEVLSVARRRPVSVLLRVE